MDHTQTVNKDATDISAMGHSGDPNTEFQKEHRLRHDKEETNNQSA
jgi:hypothetical protein